MSLICFSSINFFPSIPQPINQVGGSACNALWRRRLWLYEVNAADPFNLHGLKFYVCCSFLLFSSAKNYLGNKTKTQVHFSPRTSMYLAIKFQVAFPKFSRKERQVLWRPESLSPVGRGFQSGRLAGFAEASRKPLKAQLLRLCSGTVSAPSEGRASQQAAASPSEVVPSQAVALPPYRRRWIFVRKSMT